jgi:hypothetical protein
MTRALISKDDVLTRMMVADNFLDVSECYQVNIEGSLGGLRPGCSPDR